MISTCIQRSLRLTAALSVACFALGSVACNNQTDEEDGAARPSTSENGAQTPAPVNGANGQANDPSAVESEALATVLAFQEAVLDLELEVARTMVDEASPAYASVTSAITLLETLSNPDLDPQAREMSMPVLTMGWRGATAELVLEEGNSAIVSVTRSNGQMLDVNLNYFEGSWLIVSPADIINLR